MLVLTTFHTVLEMLQANPNPTPQVVATIPYDKSKLTTVLKPCLGSNSKTMIILTVNPTDLHLQESLTNLQFISKMRNIKVLNKSADNSGTPNNSLELKNLRNEIKDLKAAKAAVEKILKETKDTAGDLIDQWKSQYYDLMNSNKNDKDKFATLGNDLNLTHNNLQRVIQQYREQTDINARLLAIIKIYEDELVISAKQELPLMPPALENGSTNGQQ